MSLEERVKELWILLVDVTHEVNDSLHSRCL